MSLRPLRRPHRGRHGSLRLALLPALVSSALLAHAQESRPGPTQAEPAADVSFDMGFFPQGMAPKVDISRFEQSGYVAPGTYRGDIAVNRQWRAREDIVFAETADGTTHPCFSAASLARYGIAVDKLSLDPANLPAMPMPEGPFCGPLGDYVPGASLDFDSSTQVLALSVPQVYTRQNVRGYVDPSQWDAGVTAAVLGYNANIYRSSSYGNLAHSAYVGINASLHVGSWQYYHLGSASWGGPDFRYRTSAAWLQHDVPAWRAQLMVGDTTTPGQFFDPVRLRGVRLQSDDRMLPQSLRGYAPVVRGIADTNARVVVRQRGFVIYETNVAPGAFAIEDLYATGYGGDLDVEVQEADGRVRTFVVAFSNVNQLLRPGQSRWTLAAGEVEELNRIDAPRVLQGTYQRGLSNALTGFGGVTVADGYRSFLLGGAFNTPLGAVSADLTQASHRLPGGSESHGASLRMGYNKNFVDSGTDLAVAAYRYSTSGFVSLPDAAAMRDAAARGFDGDVVARQRSRMDVSINQRLGEAGGQLYLIGSTRNFWTGQGRQVDFTAGYSNRWRQLGYTLSVQRSRDTFAPLPRAGLDDRIPGDTTYVAPPRQTREDTRLFLTFSLPLGQTVRAPSLTGMYNQSRQGGNDAQLSVNGMAGSEGRLSYGAGMSYDGQDTAWNLNSQYRGGYGQAAAGLSQGSGYRQIGGGLAGGLVLHEDGLTLSPPIGDTLAIVRAPGAKGATIENGQGAKVDAAGFAIVPYMTPYELNTVVLNPKGADVGVEFEATTHHVAPRAGAVVRVDFATRVGRGVMIDALLDDGRPVPFGADVLDADGQTVGVSGQGSRLVVTGLKQSGQLSVRWGEGAGEVCHLDVVLPEKRAASVTAYEHLSGTCRVDAAAVSHSHEAAHPSMTVSAAKAEAP
ncbi:fimbria/pilus outer membrane usher protein [Stenotrophomonas maltophilia]|uniref:fimbria/pilus outer membrane usher protein n=1 Tax=Stenotrophomonas maltophilia TaxID=40324 RepID=UPI0039C1DF5D